MSVDECFMYHGTAERWFLWKHVLPTSTHHKWTLVILAALSKYHVVPATMKEIHAIIYIGPSLIPSYHIVCAASVEQVTWEFSILTKQNYVRDNAHIMSTTCNLTNITTLNVIYIVIGMQYNVLIEITRSSTCRRVSVSLVKDEWRGTVLLRLFQDKPPIFMHEGNATWVAFPVPETHFILNVAWCSTRGCLLSNDVAA